jgi:tetratricopeptide (TPR) repeat protein
MDLQLKPISKDAIAGALERVERYRLLGEPWQAESICEDILRIDPNNQDALRGLLLALTDQFGEQMQVARALEAAARLEGEYDRAYYEGIVHERAGHAHLRRGIQEAAYKAYECFRRSMDLFEQAETLRQPGNDDAVLRWNTCARTLMRHRELRPRPEEALEPVISE